MISFHQSDFPQGVFTFLREEDDSNIRGISNCISEQLFGEILQTSYFSRQKITFFADLTAARQIWDGQCDAKLKPWNILNV